MYVRDITYFVNMPETRVGIGVMIFKEGRVLLGKRRGAHGEGEFAFPGGHVEYMESFADCARRETLEECGLEIKNVRFQFLANVIRYAPKHYVHIGLVADCAGGEPQVLEPDKRESWGWYALDNPPAPLFLFCEMAFESYRTGKNYFDVSDA